jgi:TonB family protein
MNRLPLLLPLLLLLAACANSNVEVQATDQDAHQQLIEEEEETNARITQRARVVEVPPADFPATPPAAGLAGMIMVRVLVGEDGQAVEARVTQALHPDLDAAALAAALAGTYLPAREGEIPRETWLSVPFRYPPPESARD